MKTAKILVGDSEDRLKEIPSEVINCCVTSPPYYRLRDYEAEGQLGQEKTPQEYVENLVRVFRQVYRVLRNDGTCWLNIGDSYNSDNGFNRAENIWKLKGRTRGSFDKRSVKGKTKIKELFGIPWRVAFALQDCGWYLRQDIIWHKSSCMPESVTDRCTRAHEYIFLLTKSPRYYFNAKAIEEPAVTAGSSSYRPFQEKVYDGMGIKRQCLNPKTSGKTYDTRNKRDVWKITPKSYSGDHFATFPIELPEICIKAGCPKGGIVLDPFSGAGTTGVAALRNGVKYLGIDINEKNVKMSRERIRNDAPLFNTVVK